MKKFVPLVLILAACSRIPLTKNEVLSLKKTSFDELELNMASEPSNLRIDVIRQYTTTYVDETTSYEETVAYHPLGLNLGHGLFYDMNGNLSFRIDQLLNFSPGEPFEIRKSIGTRNQTAFTQYVYKNDHYSRINLPKGNFKTLYEKFTYADSSVFMKRKNLLYAISQTDTSIAYYFRDRQPLGIYKLDQNRYYSVQKKSIRKYTSYDGLITLDRNFTIQLSADKNYILINTPNRTRQNKKPKLYMTRNENKIVVYSYSFVGKKIEITENGLKVTGNYTRPVKYEKIKKKI